MNRAPHLRIGAALLAALALNGCIAAALPVLAGYLDFVIRNGPAE